jgi:hypothetical protein
LRLHGRGQRRKSSSRAPPSLPGPSLVRGTRRNNGQSGIITGTDPAGHGPSWQLDGPPSCPLQRRTPDPRPSPARHPLGQGVDHEPRQADDPPTGAGLGRPEVQPALRLGDDLSAKRSSTSSKGRWSTRSRASRRPRSRRRRLVHPGRGGPRGAQRRRRQRGRAGHQCRREGQADPHPGRVRASPAVTAIRSWPGLASIFDLSIERTRAGASVSSNPPGQPRSTRAGRT